MNKRIQRDMCIDNADVVARRLLGCRLVRKRDGVLLTGMIVEAEAYLGEGDLGAHASHGRTPRTAVMYGPPGHAYVYFTYGMHYCLNVVAHEVDTPHAVLIRAVEPLSGIEIMRENRRNARTGKLPRDVDIANGPGKLCAAMDIDLAFYGYDLVEGDSLWLEEGVSVADEDIAVGPRIGIRNAKEWIHAPLRFVIRDNPYLSR